VCREPVSLVDCFPTIVACAGLPVHAGDRDLPGASLIDIANGAAPQRTILSEYHAAGAVTGAFLVRHGRFKYVHYVGMRPQLFDLAADPQERRDLGQDPGQRAAIAACEAALRTVVDPEKADALARADQTARIAAFGGREKILSLGSFGYSPAPGTKPVYN
jgi:choline-sulfatase